MICLVAMRTSAQSRSIQTSSNESLPPTTQLQPHPLWLQEITRKPRLLMHIISGLGRYSDLTFNQASPYLSPNLGLTRELLFAYLRKTRYAITPIAIELQPQQLTLLKLKS